MNRNQSNIFQFIAIVAFLAFAGIVQGIAFGQGMPPFIPDLTAKPESKPEPKPSDSSLASTTSPTTQPATSPTSAPTTEPDTEPASQPTTRPVHASAPTVAPVAQSGPPPWLSLIQTHADQIAENRLFGTWISDPKMGTMELVLRSDGRFRLDATRGTYIIQSNLLIMTANAGRTAYVFTFDGNDLILRGGDLRQDCRFLRQSNLADALTRVLEISPEEIKRRSLRVLVALAIMITARLFILFLEGINYLFLKSSRGPLTLIWRTNKARARTVHSLVLNFITYIVYLSALGYILSELGVNYTTYIASLSVIGLAIGFGSQGLVQDMVTGFFLVLESQFDVGDMVEVSGQTGVVVEFGLRSTTIRNYVGQVVIIPNRNITQVGRYKLNSQLALIDVRVPNPEVGATTAQILGEVGHDINAQYGGVLENDPVVEPPVALATGETMVRLSVLFWPGQVWIIEQQLVPRLRAALATKNITVQPEQVTTFYHAHQVEEILDWRTSLGWRKEATGDVPPGNPGA